MLAAVLGLRNLLRLLMRGVPGGLTQEVMNTKTLPRTLACVMCAMAVIISLGCNLLFGPIIGLGIFQAYRPHEKKWPSAYDRAVVPYMRRMVTRISDEAPVASGFRFMSRLANRRRVYSLHYVYKGTREMSTKPYCAPEDVVAVAIDTADRRYLSFKRIDGGRRLREFFRKNRLEFVEAAGSVVLLLREPAESITLFETGDFTPGNRFRVEFTGRLAFLGWGRLPMTAEVGGKLPVRTVWRRVGPEDRRAYPLYLTEFVLCDKYGRVAVACRRHLGYTFYPVHDWPRGDSVRETCNLVIPMDVKPGTYTLGLRVLELGGRGLRPAPSADPRLRKTNGYIRLGKVEVASPG